MSWKLKSEEDYSKEVAELAQNRNGEADDALHMYMFNSIRATQAEADLCRALDEHQATLDWLQSWADKWDNMPAGTHDRIASLREFIEPFKKK